MVTHPFFWTLFVAHSAGWLFGWICVALVQLPSWLIEHSFD